MSNLQYPIYVDFHLLSDYALLTKHIVGSQVAIVSSEPIAKHYLSLIKPAFNRLQCNTILLPDGETHKTLTTWQHLLDFLVAHKHHRDTTLIALGGGVIGDITGFAAACYQRGVNFIQIPTTLLAQVDASIGGKTAVNHSNSKNLIGAFYNPKAVFIDVQTLNTLSERHFRAGFAEIIKIALIADSRFFCWLENYADLLLAKDRGVLIKAIKKTCAIKAAIVAKDERDQNGIRALLNLGHTFAHAIESGLNYEDCLHGEAVALGLILAADLSVRLHCLEERALSRVFRLIERFRLPTQLPCMAVEQLEAALSMDKKIKRQRNIFVLLKSIGQARIMANVPQQIVSLLLKDYLPLMV